ncbi:MAG: phage integrase SAM-like domain-containing protein, partial [Bacteroides sp.]|nr:phage integrase SAM-like domain-containing protein [Bacteroides sp.]
MRKINTYLRIHKKDSTNGVVWISFYINRQKVNFSTKVPVQIKDWNERNQRVASSDKMAKDKNLIIENVLARVNNVFVKYRLKDKKLTRDTFLRAYHRPDDYKTFFEYIGMVQRKYSNRTELSTFMTQRSVINKLKEYAPMLHFDDITRDWLDGYFCYLRKELDNNSNTAYKNMAVLKKYVRQAVKDGYMEENPFDEWHIRRGTSSCIYLTEEELSALT